MFNSSQTIGALASTETDRDYSRLIGGVGTAAIFLTNPMICGIARAAAGRFWSGVSTLTAQVNDLTKDYTYPAVKKLADASAGPIKLGLKCLSAAVDLIAPPSIWTPEQIIEMSRQRISKHDLPFANCIDFLAQQAAGCYLEKSDQIKAMVVEAVAEQTLFAAGLLELVDSVLTSNKELIAQTIKANLMHIAANLADASYEETRPFEDGQRNPIGRLLSPLLNLYKQYEERLEVVRELPAAEGTIEYQRLFNELSYDLLRVLFPNGKEDLQLYHPLLPGISLLKDFGWEVIKEKLPLLLNRFYQETRPLGGEWREKFDGADYYGLKADALMDLPSDLFQTNVRLKKGVQVDVLAPLLQNKILEKNYSQEDADQLSIHLTRYVKELLLTRNPALLDFGGGIARYMMERILSNFSRSPQGQNVAIPLHLVMTKLMENGLFGLLAKGVFGQKSEEAESSNVLNALLDSFGLAQKETFPLPAVIKDLAWSSIDQMIHTHAPAAFVNLIPTLTAFAMLEQNRKKIDAWVGDDSLTATLKRLSESWGAGLFDKLASLDFVAGKIQPFFPALNLDDEQKQAFDSFGKEVMDGVLLQMVEDLHQSYRRYLRDAASKVDPFEGVGRMFLEGDDAEEEMLDGQKVQENLSFTDWLTEIILNGCSEIGMDHLSDDEIASLRLAIDLRHAILLEQDPVKTDELQLAYFNQKAKLKPRFDAVTLHFLKALNYQSGADFPILKELQPLQPVVWNLLMENVPSILFEQAGEILLISIEKEKVKKEIANLPHGELITEGCRLLAEDLVTHLPVWFEHQLDQLPQMIVENNPQLNFSDRMKADLVNAIKAIVKGDGDVCAAIPQSVESYLEVFFLVLAHRISKMDLAKRNELLELIREAREVLVNLEDQEGKEDNEAALVEQKQVLIGLADKLLAWLGIERSQDLFGIPRLLQATLYESLKEKLASASLGIYTLDYNIRHAATENPMEEQLPASDVARSVLALTRFILDRSTDKFAERVGGEPAGAAEFFHPFRLWLGQQEEKNYKIARFAKEVVEEGVPTAWLKDLVHLLDDPAAAPIKHNIADWLNPFLSGQAIHHLSQILEKEEAGKAGFDQALLMGLLPLVTHHLRCLNEASLEPEGLNYPNFIAKAENELHPAVPPTNGVNEAAEVNQRQVHFYQGQAALLFGLIFPHGKEDMQHLFPGIVLSDDRFETIRDGVQSVIAAQLPQALEALFDRETLVIIFTNLFETVIQNLEGPIEIAFPKKPKMTPEETAAQNHMDRQVGELIVQAAAFIELPAKYFANLSYESVGATIRERFNGKLFGQQILPKALEALAARKHVKMTREEKVLERMEAEANLIDLENKFERQLLAYLFRYLGARLEHATDIFTNPALCLLRKAILAVGSFVMVRVIGSLLHLFMVEKMILGLLHKILGHGIEKTLTVFSKPQLQENLVYRAVEAFEDVLENN